jgi:hypothetical protein
MLRGPCWFEPVFDTVACVGPLVNAELARERICSALDAIDAAHEALRQTPSDAVGNAFRVDVAERLEAQDRANRGLMYRIFGEIAEPPDGSECVPAVRGTLWARLRITPKEVTRRFRLAARLRPRRSLTGAFLEPELPALAEAVAAGAVGEDHIRAVCAAVDTLPSCVSPVDVADAERTLVRHATKLDAAVVTKLGHRIADYLNPDGRFTDVDRARRRGVCLGPQGPDECRDSPAYWIPRPGPTSKPWKRRCGPGAIRPPTAIRRRATIAPRPNAATTPSSLASKSPSPPAVSGRTAGCPSP